MKVIKNQKIEILKKDKVCPKTIMERISEKENNQNNTNQLSDGKDSRLFRKLTGSINNCRDGSISSLINQSDSSSLQIKQIPTTLSNEEGIGNFERKTIEGKSKACLQL